MEEGMSASYCRCICQQTDSDTVLRECRDIKFWETLLLNSIAQNIFYAASNGNIKTSRSVLPAVYKSEIIQK